MTKSAIYFLLLVALSSCSSFTKSGRQQHAYEKYIRKSSLARDRQQVKFRANRTGLPLPHTPSEPTINTSSPESPEAVPASDSPPNQ